nr:uncharacterized protein LOC109146919 [Ipomoea trifida]
MVVGGVQTRSKQRGPLARGTVPDAASVLRVSLNSRCCCLDMGFRQIMLSEFYNKVHNGRSILCAGLVLKRMQMSWHDSKNKTDCEVYLMRHMESFVGQGVSNWDCGLVKGDYSTLHKLRLQYMKEVAVSEYNLHRARNLRRAYLLIGGPLAS